MRERSGADPGPEAAAAEYVALFGRKRLAGAVENALRAALRRVLPRSDGAADQPAAAQEL
jgi:hypothetical protein